MSFAVADEAEACGSCLPSCKSVGQQCKMKNSCVHLTLYHN